MHIDALLCTGRNSAASAFILCVCVCVCVYCVLCIVTDSAVRLKLGHLVQKFYLGMHLIHVTYEFVGKACQSNVMLKYSTICSNTSPTLKG